MTMISISLPETLLARIDKVAGSQNRNRSNFIANTMKTWIEERRL